MKYIGLRVFAVFTTILFLFTAFSDTWDRTATHKSFESPGVTNEDYFDDPKSKNKIDTINFKRNSNQDQTVRSIITRASNESEANDNGMVIEGREFFNDTTVVLPFNITVKSGAELILINTSVWVQTSLQRITIFVNAGGKLTMINSSISLELSGSSPDIRFPIHGYEICIVGDLVMINSTIAYSGYKNMPSEIFTPPTPELERWAFDGMIIVTGNVSIINSSIEYNTKVYFFQSTIDNINNSEILYNRYGIVFDLCNNVTIDNCLFIGNFQSIRVINSMNYTISNSYFEFFDFYIYGYACIKLVNSKGTMSNCIIRNYGVGILDFAEDSISNSIHHISNCTFIDFVHGIYGFGTSRFIINNSIFYNNEDQNYSYLSNEDPIGIYGAFIYVTMDNSKITNLYYGLFLLSSFVNLINCSIANNDNGIYGESVCFHAVNLTVMNNDNGIIIYGGDCFLTNSSVEGNLIGIQNVECYLMLENNRIVNNTKWGIISTITDVTLTGENFPTPTGWDASKSINGNGNFVKISNFDVFVHDSAGSPLGNIKITVEHEHLDLFTDSEFIITNIESRTDYGGISYLGSLIDYVLFNDNEKQYYENYIITASYELSDGIVIKNKTTLNIQDVVSYTIEFVMDFPDIYLEQGDLKLSRSSLKAGQTLTVQTVVHYQGPAGVTMPAINVTMYVSSSLIQAVQVEGLSSENPAVHIEFQWKAESNVPYKDRVKSRLIRIYLEPPENLEYDVGTTRFLDNNSVSTEVAILIDEDTDTSLFSTSSFGALAGFIAVIFIIILIMIIFIVKVIRKHKRVREEESEDELKKDEEDEKPTSEAEKEEE